MTKTPKKFLEKFNLNDKEELFIILYVLGGYKQTTAYNIAFPTKARTGLAPLASHLLSTADVGGAAKALAEYYQINPIPICSKYRMPEITDEELEKLINNN